MNSIISNYVWPGQCYFGLGAAALAGEQAKALGVTRVFVLADPGVVKAGLLDALLPSLDAATLSYTVYDQVVPNPDIESVDAAAVAMRASNADCIIGIGGGSGLDTAKAVRLLMGSPATVGIADYSNLLGADKLPLPNPRQFPPMIAIPTTSGTGSEATPWGVITDLRVHRKFGFGGPTLMPTVALCDPELTFGLPAFLTAATAMDALTHLIEAYVSTNNHQPALDPLILQGIALISQSLRVAVAQGKNAQARCNVMQAALLGGMAISSNWLGACHSLAHPLSSIANVQHGVANAIMLPHQMSFSLPGALERYAKIAATLDPAYDTNEPVRLRAEYAVEAVESLLEDTGLPLTLREAGVQEAQLDPLAAQAILDLNWTTNPRSVTQADLRQLYQQAFE